MLGFFSTFSCKSTSKALPGVQTPTPTATAGHGHMQATVAGLRQPAMTCSYSARWGHGEIGMLIPLKCCPGSPRPCCLPPAPAQPRLRAGGCGCAELGRLLSLQWGPVTGPRRFAQPCAAMAHRDRRLRVGEGQAVGQCARGCFPLP